MTDSNLQKQPESTPMFSDKIPAMLDSVENPFKQTESYLDWNQTINLEDSINNFYTNDEDNKFVDEDGDPSKKAFGQVAGVGTEIISGIGTDLVTAGLINPATLTATYGLSGVAYGLINFGSGFGTNVGAQKVRGEKDIDYGEAIAAGLVQMIPFGSAGKGARGIAGAALQGSATAVADQQIQKAINKQEFLTPKEALFSGTFGAGLGGAFKGSIDGLQGLYTKYAGKSAADINKVITPDEIKQVNKIVEDGKVAQKQQQESTITNQTNRVFQLPNSLKRMKPRYGMANIEFESDLDQVAYIIRSGKTKSKSEDRIVQELERQGFTRAEIKAHGADVHKKIKQIVKEQTGSATASPDNTSGLVIKVSADEKFSNSVVTRITKKKKQDLGDPTKNPQQYTNKGLKTGQLQMTEDVIKQLKDNNVFKGSKSEVATKLGGLGMFDDRVISLSNTKRIKDYVKRYAALHDLAPEDELTYALSQTVVLAADGVVDSNIKYVNALNTKNFDVIEKAIDELDDSLQKVEEWLQMGIPGRTKTGQVLRTMRYETQSGIEGKTADEVLNMTPAQKRAATEEGGDVSLNFDEALAEKQNFRAKLKDELQKAKETGDLSGLYKVASTIRQTNGEVEKIVAIQKTNVLDGLFDRSVRIFNEIGINAMLSAPTTQIVNLTSGITQSYLAALKLAFGANNVKELDAATRYFIALHSNFNFTRRAWKQSWDMEDNFINIGNIKGDTGQRFLISSDGDDIVSKAVDTGGKVIRSPMRLMTSTDALVQAPNLISAATYEAFMEGSRLGKTGAELNTFIKGHTDAILEYYAQNAKNAFTDQVVDGQEIQKDITSRILTRAQDFAKTITFTQDIRTDDIFGSAADKLNKFANKNPLARTYFAFTKTPTNILKSNARLLPGVNLPIVVKIPEGIPKIGGRTQNINVINEFILPEIRADLLNPDPIIAQQTRGELRVASAFGLTIAGLAVKYGMQLQDDEYIPPTILTGGGPNFNTPEGAAMWKAMYKDGWRPYSKGTLQLDENGEPLFGENGKPVYLYETYETIPEPIAGYIRLMVDFINSQGYIKDKPFGEFTIGWQGAVSRNIFNRSFTSQINEAMELFQAVPKIGEADSGDQDSPINYKAKKFSEYVGRQLVARGVGAAQIGSVTVPVPLPFSNLLARLKQTPGDILEIMGFSEEEIINLRSKRATRVREGDTINQELDINDPNFNRSMMAQRFLQDIINQSQEKMPGYGANLPFDVEHITNDRVLYPQRAGLDLISLNRHSKSKNYKIYDAQKLIGRLLPEPKEIITGEGFIKNARKNFIPAKLSTDDYIALKRVINTEKLTHKGFKKTLLEAMNHYLDSEHFRTNKIIIEQNGIKNEIGKLAAQEIYGEMSLINRKYIRHGERLFLESSRFGRKKIDERTQKKDNIKREYVNQLEKQFTN